MPQTKCVVRPLHLAIALFASSQVALAQDFGRIAGRVTASESSAGLTGASVAVVGSPHAAKTDDNGKFLIARIPAGAITLRVSYLERLSVTNQAYRTFVVDQTRPRQIEFYEPWVQLGFRWRP